MKAFTIMNILAIGAHFDDVELGCGGAIARHVSKGDHVTVYTATHSGYTNTENVVIRPKDVAIAEGRRAIEILGAEFVCGNFDTCTLEFIEELNVQILRLVESKKIDVVYTHWHADIHHDHSALAKSSLHSCRHVPRMLMYRSNWYHTPVEFRGNFYIDITEHWSIKERAIRSHVSELERTGEKWITFFRNEAVNAGQRIGVELAEVFEVVKWLE